MDDEPKLDLGEPQELPPWAKAEVLVKEAGRVIREVTKHQETEPVARAHVVKMLRDALAALEEE